MENNRKLYESLSSKNHVYVDVRECLIKSLFTYVFIASLKTTDNNNNNREKDKIDTDVNLSASQKSSSLGSDKKTYIPYVMWKFPDEVYYYFCFAYKNELLIKYYLRYQNLNHELLNFVFQIQIIYKKLGKETSAYSKIFKNCY